ncbi:MAG TPA: carbohydrate-binding family 9-like protein [Thermoanaerobaculia bacterium]|nr:carbohydrate-binding family 9-like protein [Thermoanaerobaculia bacterium]
MASVAPELLIVRRAAFAIEDPWRAPAGCDPIAMRRATDGTSPRLATTLVLFADDDCLSVLFNAQDDAIVATHLRHDAPLYEEDVVEIFLAPRDPHRYFEIEVNPLGTTFDAQIDSPDGTRATMRVDSSWECAGLFAAVRKSPGRLDTIVRVPFASVGSPRPKEGEEWRANFFRIDRSAEHGDEYSAWQPTMRKLADFHVPAAFGRIVFA